MCLARGMSSYVPHRRKIGRRWLASGVPLRGKPIPIVRKNTPLVVYSFQLAPSAAYPAGVKNAEGDAVKRSCAGRCSSGLGEVSCHRGKLGFTLIELMITIAVAAILLTIALPSLRDFILNNRLTSVTNDLVADLALARAEAIRRGSRVTICASDNAGTSSATCSGTDWSLGRLVFSDSATVASIDAGDERLRVYDGLGSSIALTSDSASSYMQFRPSGGTTATGTISFKFCDSRYKGRTVSIAQSGQVTTTGETGTTCP